MRIALLGDLNRRHASLIQVNNTTLAIASALCITCIRCIAHSATFLTDSLRSPLVVLTSAVATPHFVSLSHSTPLQSPSLTQSTAIALYLPLRPARSLFISLPSFGFTCFTLFVRFFYGRPFNALARTTAAAAPLRSIPRARFRRALNKTTREGRVRKSPLLLKRVPNLARNPHKMH